MNLYHVITALQTASSVRVYWSLRSNAFMRENLYETAMMTSSKDHTTEGSGSRNGRFRLLRTVRRTDGNRMGWRDGVQLSHALFKLLVKVRPGGGARSRIWESVPQPPSAVIHRAERKRWREESRAFSMPSAV